MGRHGPALAQKESLTKRLSGSWTLVSMHIHHEGEIISAPNVFPVQLSPGPIEQPYSAHPKGTLIFGQNGRFALVIFNPDIPKPAKQETPTAEEAMAIARGSFALFGK